jgi:hypothetical protein
MLAMRNHQNKLRKHIEMHQLEFFWLLVGLMGPCPCQLTLDSFGSMALEATCKVHEPWQESWVHWMKCLKAGNYVALHPGLLHLHEPTINK